MSRRRTCPKLAAHRRSLRQRTPEQWANEIGQISDPVTRCYVANAVWWDYYGDEQAGTGTTALDAWRDEYRVEVNVTPEKLAAALAFIGYDIKTAAKRGRMAQLAINRYVYGFREAQQQKTQEQQQ